MSACSRRDFLKGSHAGDRDPEDMVSSRAAGCFNQERREVHLSTRSSRPGRNTTESFACWNSRPRCTAKVGQAPGSTGSRRCWSRSRWSADAESITDPCRPLNVRVARRSR